MRMDRAKWLESWKGQRKVKKKQSVVKDKPEPAVVVITPFSSLAKEVAGLEHTQGKKSYPPPPPGLLPSRKIVKTSPVLVPLFPVQEEVRRKYFSSSF